MQTSIISLAIKCFTSALPDYSIQVCNNLDSVFRVNRRQEEAPVNLYQLYLLHKQERCQQSLCKLNTTICSGEASGHQQQFAECLLLTLPEMEPLQGERSIFYTYLEEINGPPMQCSADQAASHSSCHVQWDPMSKPTHLSPSTFSASAKPISTTHCGK